jgi:hypothetical protein
LPESPELPKSLKIRGYSGGKVLTGQAAFHKKANLTTDDTDLQIQNGPVELFLIRVNQCYQRHL